LSPTALTSILVGYATSTNGYRILITNTEKVEETSHVDFAESTMPGMPPGPDESIIEAPKLQSSLDATVEPRSITVEEAAETPAIEPAEASIVSAELESNKDPEPSPEIEHLLEVELLPECERKPPQYLKDYVRPSVKRAEFVAEATITARATRIKYKEAAKDPGIRDAMKAELDHLLNSGAVKIVDLRKGGKAIKPTWAHKRKLGPY
jgi:hypothetical protein